MDLVKCAVSLTLLASSIAWAQGLSLTIGSSVAGQNYAMKSAQFIFRVNGCADLSKAQVSVTAEVPGRSTPVAAAAAPTQAGVYAISDRDNNNGVWLAAITATCKGEIAGALVPVAGMSFVREGTQLLSHAPSKAEIDAAVRALPPAPSRAR